jgi:hypothetical protein
MPRPERWKVESRCQDTDQSSSLVISQAHLYRKKRSCPRQKSWLLARFLSMASQIIHPHEKEKEQRIQHQKQGLVQVQVILLVLDRMLLFLARKKANLIKLVS